MQYERNPAVSSSDLGITKHSLASTVCTFHYIVLMPVNACGWELRLLKDKRPSSFQSVPSSNWEAFWTPLRIVAL